MAWWAWMILGVLLAGAELTGVDAAFYLIFLGAAALVMGLLGFAGLELPEWGQYLTYAVLAITSMVLFREKLYTRFSPGFTDFAGQVVRVKEDVPQGAETRVDLRGTQYTAVNRGAATIKAGANARITEKDRMPLEIEAMPAEQPASD